MSISKLKFRLKPNIRSLVSLWDDGMRVGYIRYKKPFKHTRNDEIYMGLVCEKSLEESIICHMLQSKRILEKIKK